MVTAEDLSNLPDAEDPLHGLHTGGWECISNKIDASSLLELNKL